MVHILILIFVWLQNVYMFIILNIQHYTTHIIIMSSNETSNDKGWYEWDGLIFFFLITIFQTITIK